MDSRWGHAKPTGQLADRLVAFQRFKRDLSIKLWMMLLPS
jgi:hypothetical protein